MVALAALLAGGTLAAAGRALRLADVLAPHGEALVLAAALVTGAVILAAGALHSRRTVRKMPPPHARPA
jgi:hypothetical protein